MSGPALKAADAYETEAYTRIRVTPCSGIEVWVCMAS